MAEKVLIEFEVDSRGAVRNIKEVKGALDEVDDSGKKSAAGGVASFKAALAGLGVGYIASQLTELAATVARVGVDMGMHALKTADSFDQMRRQLVALRGDAGAAEKDFDWIKAFAKNTPLQLEEVTGSFQKLLAFGLEPTDGTMQSLVDTAMKLGGGMERTEGVILAVGQAWAKGKLQGEEALQLLERGVPVWEMLGKVLNKTTEEVQELSQKGLIGRDAISALIAEMGASSVGAAASQMETLSGKVSNLQDIITQAFAEIGEQAMPAAKEAISELIAIFEELKASGDFKAMGDAFADVMAAMADAARLLHEQLDNIKKSLIVLDSAMKMVSPGYREMREGFRNTHDGIVLADGALQAFSETYRGIRDNFTRTDEDDMLAALGMGKDQLEDIAKASEEYAKKLEAQTRAAEAAARAQQALNGTMLSRSQMDASIAGVMPDLGWFDENWASNVTTNIERAFNEVRLSGSLFSDPAWLVELREAIKRAVAAGMSDGISEPNKWDKVTLSQAFRDVATVFVDTVITGIMEGFSSDEMRDAFASAADQLSQAYGQRLSDSIVSGGNGAWGFQDGVPGEGWRNAGMAFGLGLLQTGLQNQSNTQAVFGGALTGASVGSQAGPWGALIGALVGGGVGYSMNNPNNTPRWLDPLDLTSSLFGDPAFTSFALYPGVPFNTQQTSPTDEQTLINLGEQERRLRELLAMLGDDAFNEDLGAIQDEIDMILANMVDGGHDIGSLLRDINAAENQGMSPEAFELMWQQLMSQMRNANLAYRSVLQQFGDANLFGEIRGATGLYYQGEGEAEEIAQIISNLLIPQMMEDNYQPALAAGLAGLGMDVDAVTRLFEELSTLPAADRLDALSTFIRALRVTAELLEANPLELARQSTTEAFETFMASAQSQIDILAAGWDRLTLVDRAAELENIGMVFEQALQQTVQMLQAIDSAQEAINQGWSRLIEQLQFGGMWEEDRVPWLQGRISDIMGQLAGATSIEEINFLNSELMRYIQQLGGMVDLEAQAPWEIAQQYGFTADEWVLDGGATWREVLIRMMEDAQSAANAQLDMIREQVQAQYDELAASILDARNALGVFGAELTRVAAILAGIEGGEKSAPVNLMVRVYPTGDGNARVTADNYAIS